MKKVISAVMILSILLCFNGCEISDLDEEPLIYYNGKFYDNPIASSGSRANTFWLPLSTADIEDTGYFCYENDDVTKLRNRDKVKIKRFSDEELSMFITFTDFWDEWLYLDTSYEMPSFSAEDIEEFVLKRLSDDAVESYKKGRCIIIQDEDDIENIVNSLLSIDRSKNAKSYRAYEVHGSMDFYVKYKGINALYDFGIVGYAEKNLVFTNTHIDIEGIHYVVYDKDTPNPFDVLKIK